MISSGLRPLLLAAVCWLGLTSLVPAIARAQAAWEYSPYDVQIWIASHGPDAVPPAVLERLAESVARRTDILYGSAWSVQASPAPPVLQSTIAARIENLSVDDLLSRDPKALNHDKLMLVALSRVDGWFDFKVRELDCRSQQWSVTVDRSAATYDELATIVYDALSEVFTPLAKIESVDGRDVVARVRAGGLVSPDDVRLQIKVDDVLRPVVRRNDRSGQPTPGGIQVPEWTLLRVTQSDQGRLECRLVSGFRAPIPIKGGQRTERLALLVKPTFPETRLVLVSRTKPTRPLGGYKIYRQGAGEEEPELLGVSAADGSFVLPQTDGKLQPLLIRSGSQLLARLPVLPGQSPELTATLIDDDGRLRAEGFVLSFQSRVMDLVARRELVAARFRKYLAAGELKEAQAALEEYRLLESRADMSRVLDQQQQLITSTDRTTRLRIEKHFSDARKLLLKFLDPEVGNVMARDLAAAKARPAGGKAATTPAAPTTTTPTSTAAAP